MKYDFNLLLSDILKEKKQRVLSDIEARRGVFNHYLIVLPDREDENLEIHPSKALEKTVWKDKEWFVVGVAVGYQDALDMIQTFVQEVYDSTGNVNIREYILEQQRHFEEGKL